jgi:hypothetical protein
LNGIRAENVTPFAGKMDGKKMNLDVVSGIINPLLGANFD